MTNDAQELFARWVDAYDRKHDYPMLLGFGAVPDYAKRTITERIEPWATNYDELQRELPYDCPECGGPEKEFYRPTRKLHKLDRRLARLEAKGFREVPNPAYDEERAEAWKQRYRPQPVFAEKIMVGQAYTPMACEQAARAVVNPAFDVALATEGENETHGGGEPWASSEGG